MARYVLLLSHFDLSFNRQIIAVKGSKFLKVVWDCTIFQLVHSCSPMVCKFFFKKREGYQEILLEFRSSLLEMQDLVSRKTSKTVNSKDVHGMFCFLSKDIEIWRTISFNDRHWVTIERSGFGCIRKFTQIIDVNVQIIPKLFLVFTAFGV